MKMNSDIANVIAYVGPGPGLTMVWAFIVLLGTILLAFLSLLLWPIRMVIRKIRGTQPENPESKDASASTPSAPASTDARAEARGDSTTTS